MICNKMNCPSLSTPFFVIFVVSSSVQCQFKSGLLSFGFSLRARLNSYMHVRSWCLRVFSRRRAVRPRGFSSDLSAACVSFILDSIHSFVGNSQTKIEDDTTYDKHNYYTRALLLQAIYTVNKMTTGHCSNPEQRQ